MAAPDEALPSELTGPSPVPPGARIGDTLPEVARRYRELLLRRSGEERLKMGCSMHATAKALVRASILEAS